MLLCLNQEDRLALILGEILALGSDESADIMAITPAAYRQRLSRARRTLIAFVARSCGVVNPDSPCRCHKHVDNKIAAGQLDPTALCYAQRHDTVSLQNARQAAQNELQADQRAIALIRSHPAYTSRIDCHAFIDGLFTPDDPDRQ
jgi:hypothetical protein